MPGSHARPATALERDLEIVAEALTRTRFRYRHEIDLHAGIVGACAAAGFVIPEGECEVRLSVGERIDFLLRSGLGIEVKIKGPTRGVWSQMHRYATHDRVRGLLLVTTLARHAAGAPFELDEKPVHTLVLRGAW